MIVIIEGTDLVGKSTLAERLAADRGQFGLYRWEMGGGPGGPAPHFHRTISESPYVLEGSVDGPLSS